MCNTSSGKKVVTVNDKTKEAEGLKYQLETYNNFLLEQVKN